MLGSSHIYMLYLSGHLQAQIMLSDVTNFMQLVTSTTAAQDTIIPLLSCSKMPSSPPQGARIRTSVLGLIQKTSHNEGTLFGERREVAVGPVPPRVRKALFTRGSCYPRPDAELPENVLSS
ncbi:hypothetical protein BDZ89DRAFT_426326 [Hymenopellis radicata]|nr:hypothetical protein BDZ89DRAFT_426326 [Hymenopellis radicata]